MLLLFLSKAGENKKSKPKWFALKFKEMVGMTGFEPAASSSRTMRATKLCHIPTTSNIILWTRNKCKQKNNDICSILNKRLL